MNLFHVGALVFHCGLSAAVGYACYADGMGIITASIVGFMFWWMIALESRIATIRHYLTWCMHGLYLLFSYESEEENDE